MLPKKEKEVMLTVNEVSRLTGVSVRTLQYYDSIGLLKPAEYTGAGYRLYDDNALSRLQQILLYRELEFSLKDIKKILTAPDFDRKKALVQQISLLEMKKEHLEDLLLFAREMKERGDVTMDFSAFDTTKMEEYAAKAKEQWGRTDAYREYEKKAKDRTQKEEAETGKGLMQLFAEFGAMKAEDAGAAAVQAQVKKLKDYITEHYYTCTDEILSALGAMYAAGGDFTENIDAAGGSGTAEFAAAAIERYCRK